MIDLALSPLSWLLCGVAAFALFRRHRIMRASGATIAIVALVLMTPLGANALVALVESRAPPADTCALMLMSLPAVACTLPAALSASVTVRSCCACRSNIVR